MHSVIKGNVDQKKLLAQESEIPLLKAYLLNALAMNIGVFSTIGMRPQAPIWTNELPKVKLVNHLYWWTSMTLHRILSSYSTVLGMVKC